MFREFGKDFSTIESIKIEGDFLVCQFQNQDVARLQTSQLVPRGFSNPRWSDAHLGEGNWTIVVPASPEPFQIPWEVVRNLTHDEFARYMANRTAMRSRKLGRQLKELRISRGLSQKRVAKVVGIEPSNLSRIENGEYDVATSTLLKILSATGASSRELGL